MSANPLELWEHAQTLPEDTEPQRRAKISRSYYALYSHACIFSKNLASEGLEIKAGSGTHRKLIAKLTNPTVTDETAINVSRNIGTQQMLAYDYRLKADYSLTESVTNIDVKKCLAFVKKGLSFSLE